MPTAKTPLPAHPPDGFPLAAIHLFLKIFGPNQPEHEADWDKAIPWPCLLATGLNESLIRELLAAGWLEHLLETTANGDQRRTFHRLQEADLTPRSCFVLTRSGFSYAQELMIREDGVAIPPLNSPHRDLLAIPHLNVPRWDGNTGELWLDGQLLKRFRHQAANQRYLLDALEAAKWPACLPNPFRLPNTLKPKKCLHRTIESLNRGQHGTLRLRFCGDGQGGLRWEKVI